MSVIRLDKTGPAKAAKRPASGRRGSGATLRGRGSAIAAAGVFAVALTLLGLSLSHLASGVAIVTAAGARDGWLMAIGIDMGFVALELAMLVAPPAARPAVARYASPAIVGTLAVSEAMNAFAFAAHTSGWLVLPAIGLGLAVPALGDDLIKGIPESARG